LSYITLEQWFHEVSNFPLAGRPEPSPTAPPKWRSGSNRPRKRKPTGSRRRVASEQRKKYRGFWLGCLISTSELWFLNIDFRAVVHQVRCGQSSWAGSTPPLVSRPWLGPTRGSSLGAHQLWLPPPGDKTPHLSLVTVDVGHGAYSTICPALALHSRRRVFHGISGSA
jgi:hypothetical protein